MFPSTVTGINSLCVFKISGRTLGELAPKWKSARETKVSKIYKLTFRRTFTGATLCQRGLAIDQCPSVCPSVRHTPVLCLSPSNRWFLGPTWISPKPHLDRISRFMQGTRRWPTDRHTHRQTDHATPSVFI